MASIVSITRFVNGLPDQTTLGPVTVTLAITRDSDAAVILPAGTATTNPSTGVYSYDYGGLALDPAQTYTATFTVVDATGSSQVLRAIAATAARRSLRAYRRALVGTNQLGPHSLATTTANAATADQLVVGALADADRNERSYQGWHAYLASGALLGQQRRVKVGGFSAASGTLTMSRVFGGLVASGTAVELHGRLPAIPTEDGRAGLREVLNWALEVCPQVIRLPFDAASGQYQYGLDSLPWLTEAVQVGGLYDPSSGGLNPLAHPGGARLRLDAETPLLEIDQPFTTGQRFEVELSIPGDRWVKTGGAWGRSDVGLVNDDDEALVDRRLLVQVALAYAFRALAGLVEPHESDYWLRRADVQERKAAWIKFYGQQRVSSGGGGVGIVGGRRWPAGAGYGRGWV